MITKQDKFWWFLLIIVCCVSFDQLSKRWAKSVLKDDTSRFSVSIDGASCPSWYRTRYPKDTKHRATKACRSAKNGRVTRAVVDVIPGHFEFEYAQNPGAAFGLFAKDPPWWGRPYMHTASALGLLFFFALGFSFSRARYRWGVVGTALCAGGAIGNIWDRIQFGYVIDFVVWRVEGFQWPTFNIADACVSVGFFGLLGLALFESVRSVRRRTKPAAEQARHAVAEQARHAVAEQARHAGTEPAKHAVAEQARHAVAEQARHAGTEPAKHAVAEQAKHAVAEQARQQEEE